MAARAPITTTPTAMPIPIAAPVEREELPLLELLFALVFAPFALDVVPEDPESVCWPSWLPGSLPWSVEALSSVCVAVAAAIVGVVDVNGSAALGVGVEKAPKPLELALPIS